MSIRRMQVRQAASLSSATMLWCGVDPRLACSTRAPIFGIPGCQGSISSPRSLNSQHDKRM